MADIIQTVRRPPSWEANVATGVLGGIDTSGWTTVVLGSVSPANSAATNTAAIHAAISAAAEETVLVLPSGTIPVNAITFGSSGKSRVVLRGAGMFDTILQSGASGVAITSGGDPSFNLGPSAIISSLTRGQTTISVTQVLGESANGFTAGHLVLIAPYNDWTKPVTGYNRNDNLRTIYTKVTAVVNTGGSNRDITIEAPIPGDYPEGAIIKQVAHAGSFGLGTHVNLGLEDLTIDCQNTATTGWYLQGNHSGCWAQNVFIKDYVTNGLWALYGAQFEAKTVLVRHGGGGGGTRASFHFGDISGLLVHNCTGLGSVGAASGILTQGSVTRSAYFGNLFMEGANYVNHIGPEQFVILEGNGISCLQHDNYHQSGSEASLVRNTFFGLNGYGNWDTSTGLPTTGWVSTESVGLPPGYAAKRWSRNFTFAKNRFGMDGFIAADADNFSLFGYPNIGNLGYYGTQTGGTWQDWDPTANSGDGGPHEWTATVASRSDFNGTYYTTGVFTITGGDLTVLNDRITDAIANFTWSGNTVSFTFSPSAAGAATGVSGSTGTLVGTALTINTVTFGVPAPGTPVTIWPGAAGFQEQDLDVEATAVTADNITETGTLLGDALGGGDTVADSYTWPDGPPHYWGGYDWPPNIQTLKDFPAGQNYLTFLDTGSFDPGEEGEGTGTPEFSPAGGVYSGTQVVEITSSTPGATIRYTTDGSTPSQSHGTIYSVTIGVAATTTIKAMAYKTGLVDSATATETYTISAPGGGGGASAGVLTATMVILGG